MSDVPAIVDLVDVDSLKWKQLAAESKLAKRCLYGLEARRIRKLECEIATSARAGWFRSAMKKPHCLIGRHGTPAHAVSVMVWTQIISKTIQSDRSCRPRREFGIYRCIGLCAEC